MTSKKSLRAAAEHGRGDSTQRIGQPGNRPRGAPLPAARAAGAFAVVFALLLAELYGCLSDLAGFDFGRFMLAEIIVGVTIVLLILGGLSSGKIWVIRLFRWSTFLAAALYFVVIACGAYLYSGKTPIDSGLALVILVLSIVQLPLFIVIYRAFARVRWLDPKSQPSEWEAPAAAGSVDPRYRRDKTPAKIGKGGWIFICLLGVAGFVRYCTSLIGTDWVSRSMASGNLWKEAMVIIAFIAPIVAIAAIVGLKRRAALRGQLTSE